MPISTLQSGSFPSNVAIDTDTLVVDGANNRVGVGTTSAPSTLISATSGGGIALDPDSFSAWNREATSSNHSHLVLNQTGVDAQYLQFRKDGTTVGSIGVGNASSYTYIGTGDTGLMFNSGNDFLQPWNPSTNATRDAAIDIGRSSSRFKDLYLSGGVYLGGTGAANQLHYYEEGTWNITLSGGLTPTINSAHYTVIGNRVFLNCSIQVPANSNGTSIIVGGLPFATNGDGSGSLSYTTATTSNAIGILVQSSSVYFYKGGTGYTLAEFSNHALRFTAQYRINN